MLICFNLNRHLSNKIVMYNDIIIVTEQHYYVLSGGEYFNMVRSRNSGDWSFRMEDAFLVPELIEAIGLKSRYGTCVTYSRAHSHLYNLLLGAVNNE